MCLTSRELNVSQRSSYPLVALTKCHVHVFATCDVLTGNVGIDKFNLFFADIVFSRRVRDLFSPRAPRFSAFSTTPPKETLQREESD